MEANKQTRQTPSREADTDLGRRVHMIMWDHKLTQGVVANHLGMSSDSLGRKLKGERGWAIAEVIAVAEHLDTTVAYLVGETENPHPENPDRGNTVGLAGIEPTTTTVEYGRLAPVTPIRRAA